VEASLTRRDAAATSPLGALDLTALPMGLEEALAVTLGGVVLEAFVHEVLVVRTHLRPPAQTYGPGCGRRAAADRGAGGARRPAIHARC
jgi:hypothetical protein